MPQYKYKAINNESRKISGQLQAVNEKDLHNQLLSTGLRLVNCSEVSKGKAFLFFSSHIKTKELVQLCIHLEQLSAAGIPLIEGLEDVRDSTEQPRLHNLLSNIYRKVNEGSSLSEAFGSFPKVFGPVFIALIEAGEETGNLTDSFNQLVKHLKWKESVSRKIKKATRYPSFMILVMFFLFYFMMTYVVPEVLSFLMSTGQELPFITKTLVFTSGTVQKYSIEILSAPFVLFFGFKLIHMSEAVAYNIDRLILEIPILGTTIKKIALSRFSHFFAVMFQSGVPILDGLATSQKVVVNKYIHHNLEMVRESVKSGESLSASMEKWGQFPSLVIRMVRIGEDSGSLAKTLGNVTDFYDQEVDDTIDSLISMVEPTLTIAAGLMMGWIVAGVIGPIYDTFEQVGL